MVCMFKTMTVQLKHYNSVLPSLSSSSCSSTSFLLASSCSHFLICAASLSRDWNGVASELKNIYFNNSKEWCIYSFYGLLSFVLGHIRISKLLQSKKEDRSCLVVFILKVILDLKQLPRHLWRYRARRFKKKKREASSLAKKAHERDSCQDMTVFRTGSVSWLLEDRD